MGRCIIQLKCNVCSNWWKQVERGDRSQSSRVGGVLRKGSKRVDGSFFMKRGGYSMSGESGTTLDETDARG